jgi:streptogramin lyase
MADGGRVRFALTPIALVVALLGGSLRARADDLLAGRIADEAGAPVAGAMVTVSRGDPAQLVTVFTSDDGGYRAPLPGGAGALALRVRRIGFRDLRVADPTARDAAPLVLARETDPAALAAQLPANHWYALVLERLADPAQREELVRQCTYCHQQGNEATRRRRSDEEWRKVLALMGRMGGMVSDDLRARIPSLFNEAYDPAVALPALGARLAKQDLAPAPAARRARIDEWELGGRASMQHDLLVHPDGRIYSVDMQQDMLFRLDPSQPDGRRESWRLPQGDLPLGGVFATTGEPLPPTSNAHVGPHSLQVAPDGSIWITLALGNQLARFDPASEQFTTHALRWGYYPHTLRFDAKGRVWYTIAASNHLGMFDPRTGESREIRLPAPTLAQDATLRLLPLFLWLGRFVDLRGAAAESEGMNVPIPYGIDVAPDGGVWFSQLNAHRIGRMDPDRFAVEIVETPFPAPRRLRFDSQGALWIPSFSGGQLARFDPATRAFRTWEIPIEPRGSDVPYALNVDRRTDTVWICGTNSDTLIRFEPMSQAFTVYPLPTRVTYTREIDFDAQGRVWTSNSNAPAWQIETGIPKVLRLDPEWSAAPAQTAGAIAPGPAAHLRHELAPSHSGRHGVHGVDVDRLTRGR